MTDREVQSHIQSALEFEPSIDAADIGVSVDDGVVTLRGEVSSYSQKVAAEGVAFHVYGVKAVANDLTVKLLDPHHRSDADIAHAAATALQCNSLVPRNRIKIKVEQGWVTLRGEVNWDFQRAAAARMVRDLAGVRGVTNAVTLLPHVSAADVQAKIEAALQRTASLHLRHITVDVQGDKVALSGTVHTCFERSQARHAAWAAPGVKEVDDRIAVVP